MQNQVEAVDKLAAAIRTHPDVDAFLTRSDHFAGSGADYAVARAFVEWRNRLNRLVDEVEDNDEAYRVHAGGS